MELGCGTGQLSFALIDSFSSCVGVDPAAGMIEVLSEKIADSAESAKMSAVCANLLEGPPPADLVIPGGYDLIFSKLAWHHIPDRSGMVKACGPLLAPGGRLLILDIEDTPTNNSRHFHTPEMTIGVEYESDGISEEDVRCWFAEAGLTDVEIERAQFEQKTHAGWVAQGIAETSEFTMMLASAAAKPAAKL
jgi:SAM-dependent methyltransferase